MSINWKDTEWLAQVEAWIRSQLTVQNIAISGPIEQPHVRPWATVLRIPTSAGIVFFKATTPALAYEPALTEALSRWRPDCMPQVLASDTESGWLLMHDAGTPLRAFIQAEKSYERWLKLLPLYAEVQIQLARHADELLALGMLDRRLSRLPVLYENLLDNQEALMIGHPGGLTPEEYQELKMLAPRIGTMCQELARVGIPETLHHDDFHDANIFVKEGRVTFADWAESGIGHPFFTLVVMLRSTAYQLSWNEDAPELAYLRDAYLEPFTQFDTRQNLVTASRSAHRLGMFCRTLTWHHVVSSLDEPERSEYAEAVPGWLQEFLGGKLTASD
ncbi:phosphotransferase [Chloroflexi bacterium TSY]|nr:phosphotransferase [Chloroflexi bacterium TSY]